MTVSEKLEMYANKKDFIRSISKAFESGLSKSSVTSVEYELYQKKVSDGDTYFLEYIVVNYIGGAKGIKFVGGNSNVANFHVVDSLLNGGYYAEEFEYQALASKGYTFVPLGPTNDPLDEFLSKPMNHIGDIRRCFNYCKNSEDVERVIDRIPAVFGSFTVEFSEDGETFLITNSFVEDRVYQTEEVEYEFRMES